MLGMPNNDVELSCFSSNSEGSAVVGFTKKPRKNTDYFAPATTRPTRMLYFLQRYKPQEPVTKACEDGTGGGSNRESPAAISGPSISDGNQHERGVVNKTYTLAKWPRSWILYSMFAPTLKLRLHVRIPRTTIRGWKGFDRQPIDRKKSRWRSWTKLELAILSHIVKTLRMNYRSES